MEAFAHQMQNAVPRFTGPYTSNVNDLLPTYILVLATVVVLYIFMGPGGYGAGRAKRDSLYGLEHGRLNMAARPTTMWMNIGFWKNTKDFPTACQDLLIQVLTQAGLVHRLDDGEGVRPAPGAGTVHILDLGFGCGDQTLCLAGIWQGNPFHYVGLTLNQTQYRCASSRLAEASVCDAALVKLHCANAARPAIWRKETVADILSLRVPRSQDPLLAQGDQGDIPQSDNTWVLALDTLYHFKPSRLPVLSFAAKELRASLMAFDFLRADTASPCQRILLRLVALLGGCPASAFMTENEYCSMLLQAGYDSNIEILDVTEHAFLPLSEFMSRQEEDLKRIGLSLGKLKAGKWLFTWFAKSNLVRAVIVIARRSKGQDI